MPVRTDMYVTITFDKESLARSLQVHSRDREISSDTVDLYQALCITFREPDRGCVTRLLLADAEPIWDSKLPQIQDFPCNSGHPCCLNLVRKSFQNSSFDHEHTRKTHPNSPSRVIEISGPHTQRLHVARGERADFVTLSHRWVPVHPGTTLLRLLKENIESLRQDIPCHMLSKTFQDAVAIARAAGFPYIWIDSLCIIQDDEEDLRKEIGKMADIYSEATLSIFALQPDGCFTQRPDHSRHPCINSPFAH